MKTWALFGSMLFLGAAACGAKSGLEGYEPPPGAGDTQGDRTSTSVGVEAPKPFACVAGSFRLTKAVPQVMFVVDRSGSMNESLPGKTPNELEPAKWNVLSNALQAVLGDLSGQAEVGAKFFPEPPPDSDFNEPTLRCKVAVGPDVPPAGATTDAIMDAVHQTVPRGGTPTAEAIRAMTTFLSANERRAVARFIVLATDGAPTCNGDLDPMKCVCAEAQAGCRHDPYECLDDARTLAAIRDANDKARIPVYVLGLGDPGRPEFTQTLDRMAAAGGRPRAAHPAYFEAKDPVELESALGSITRSVARCAYVTPSRPNDPDAIRIELDGARVDRDPDHGDGWDWIDRDFGEIAFFGAACDRLAVDVSMVPTVVGDVTCE